ncbi:uncharacterized protein LOC130613827 [Hydractinia symbiolongicarpus]|uniref:uncharacterized protein LOC130613827 n=1 Tax=Hydractinia symbiolongicarpus TaxID=13093 RepID=UPI00254FDE85|nr:uncharacterized protein LOC130613827 [Hydractinia symbiolongicarpus]
MSEDKIIYSKSNAMSIQELIDLLEQSKTLATNNLMNLWCIKKLVLRFGKFFPVFIMCVNIPSGITVLDVFKNETAIAALMFLVLLIILLTDSVIFLFLFLFSVVASLIFIFKGLNMMNMRGYYLIEGNKTYSEEKKKLNNEVYKPLEEISQQLTSFLELALDKIEIKHF